MAGAEGDFGEFGGADGVLGVGCALASYWVGGGFAADGVFGADGPKQWAGVPGERSGVTGSDGVAEFRGLAAGEYWLEASHYGISAASHCFHIAARASWRAKGRVRYEWGDYPVWTRGVDGVIVDSQAGTGGTPVQNQLRRNRLPIRGARVVLIDPRRGEVRRAVSDDKGAFAFASGVPAGTYVLHVEGGESNRPFDSDDQLIAVGPGSAGAGLVIERRDAGGTECGDTVVEVRSR